MTQREALLNSLRQQPEVTVLVIGGGINGIGTFRDLALQGLDVLLVEKADYGSGASAASSHMLHGGIRYLENGEFRLVREALTERNLMLRNAPHYAKPLPTTIPIFSWFSGFWNAPLKFLQLRDKPSERGAVVIKLGLILYDIFARDHRVMPTHTMQGRTESFKHYPQMNSKIVCTASYYDAWMPSPERICLEQVLDAEAISPKARAVNYVSVVGATEDGTRVILRDEITGETYTVKPKVVVNAAGPWIDFANSAMGQKTKFIGGTKGSHLILDNPELLKATNGHEIFFENHDGRIVLILPFVDKVMIGTTDIRVENPDEAVCTDDEITYLLELVSKVYPNIHVDRSQIIFQFCGVRPLPSSDKTYTGNVSRDHSIRVLEPSVADSGGGVKFPVYNLIGGKWTTFRAFAEQTTDKVLAFLGKPRTASTKNLPIGGGRDYPHDDAARQAWIARVSAATQVPSEQVAVLFERYGTRAEDLAKFISHEQDAPLESNPRYSRRELIYLAQHEALVRLDDLLLRRTLMAWLGQVDEAVLHEVAALVAQALGWSDERKTQEIQRTIDLLRAKHGLTLRSAVTA